MFCGIDFGTTNCSAGVIDDDKVVLVPLENDRAVMPTQLFVFRNHVDTRWINKDKSIFFKKIKKELKRYKNESEEKYQQRLNRREQKNQKELSAKQLFWREAIEREKKKYVSQSVDTLDLKGDIYFGSTASDLHSLNPSDGIYFKSPKSFLGSKISLEHQERFQKIVTALLINIRDKLQAHRSQEIDSVLFGRPVNYSSVNGESGNIRALSIMENSARDAGFKFIEFQYEPVAAAFSYEQTLSANEKVLVVDIGGGTTDVTMMKLSPKGLIKVDRKNDILASNGTKIGGNDIDAILNTYRLMPYLGKESFDENGIIINQGNIISNKIYSDAATINDLHALECFRNSGEAIESAYKRATGQLKAKIKRLSMLRKKELVYKFAETAEQAKILLSSSDEVILPVDFLGNEFDIIVSRSKFRDAVVSKVTPLRKVIDDVISDAGTQPDKIFVTGGSAKSPVLIDMLFTENEKNKLVFGDYFGSVAEGLTLGARQLFR